MDLWIKDGLSGTTTCLFGMIKAGKQSEKWCNALVSHTVKSQQLVPSALWLRAGQCCAAQEETAMKISDQ